jgi:predicted TIM-barrel fold metal-dependent hydrolase
MINAHVHLFTIQSIPERFFGLRFIMKLMWSRLGVRVTRILLSWVGNVLNHPQIDRLSAFAGIGAHASPREVFELLQGYYPPDASFIVLPMDFEYMAAGRPKKSYMDQLDDLIQLKRDPHIGPRIYPFVAVDPRRPDLLQLVRHLVESEHFSGIKIYPALGFFPFDTRLDPLWQWAEALQIPIMTHCSRGGAYFRGPLSTFPWPKEAGPKPKPGTPNAKWTDLLSDPSGFKHVFQKYPNLKVCFAHMGGTEECRKWLSEPWPKHLGQTNWLSIILELMKAFPQVYADISYSAYDAQIHPLIDVLVRDELIGRRILFGSDFYMVQQNMTERAFSIQIKSLLSNEAFHRISEINTKQCLCREKPSRNDPFYTLHS